MFNNTERHSNTYHTKIFYFVFCRLDRLLYERSEQVQTSPDQNALLSKVSKFYILTSTMLLAKLPLNEKKK